MICPSPLKLTAVPNSSPAAWPFLVRLSDCPCTFVPTIKAKKRNSSTCCLHLESVIVIMFYSYILIVQCKSK